MEQVSVQHFRSFGDEVKIGLKPGLNVIVGPNGSGKSNVIDALLFVFGKRAKQIRLNKVSELIHKSDEHSGYEFAKVDVHFAEINDKVLCVAPRDGTIVADQPAGRAGICCCERVRDGYIQGSIQRQQFQVQSGRQKEDPC